MDILNVPASNAEFHHFNIESINETSVSSGSGIFIFAAKRKNDYDILSFGSSENLSIDFTNKKEIAKQHGADCFCIKQCKKWEFETVLNDIGKLYCK